jgi:signal transduction histidine kinase
MDGASDLGGLPRQPFLERITPSQWIALDVAIAGFSLSIGTVALFVVPNVTHPLSVSRWVLWPLIAAATIPIAFRRRWPEASLVCICGALTVTTMLGVSLAPAPVLALPLYSVILKYSRRQSLVILAAIEGIAIAAFIVAAVLRPIQGDVTFNVVLAGATWFVGDSIRTRRAYQAGLVSQERERQRQELDRANRAIADERMEIARELHDVIAHSLSVIAIQSGVGRHVIDTQPDEARSALAAIEETSRSALHELRQVLIVLRNASTKGAELDPSPSLSDLTDLVEKMRSAGVPVDLQISGRSLPLPRGLELSVYRIVQEALTNVIKHARSAHTWVRLQYGEDCLTVSVTNAALGSGLGASDKRGQRSEFDEHDRHGIIGMRERASAFQGTLTANELPDGGFEVRASMPIGGGRP